MLSFVFIIRQIILRQGPLWSDMLTDVDRRRGFASSDLTLIRLLMA